MPDSVPTILPAPGAEWSVIETQQALEAGFAGALAARPGSLHESHYQIAGHSATIRLVGHRLALALTRALAHLRVDSLSGPAELSIDMWDEKETGVGSPVCRPHEDPSRLGTTDASADGRFIVFEQARIKSVLDRSRQCIVGWVSSAEELTQYEKGRPWHSELLLWQRDRGLQPVHAGFVERDGFGLLLGGPGGSGKSTTALVCMAAGWSYLADDYVALERLPAGGFAGYGTYGSAHLEPAHLQRFPTLVPNAIPGRLAREDKSLVLLSDLPESRLGGRAEVRALALPRVVDRPTTSFRPATKGEALLRLAPSSLLLLPYVGLGHSAFETMTELVQRLPTYWLELGRDFEQLPVAVNQLLAKVTQG